MTVRQYSPHPDMEPVPDSVESRFPPLLQQMVDHVHEDQRAEALRRAQESIARANEAAGVKEADNADG
jgi:phage terminase Nu1 subunit (DNA packaging protein)